MTSDNREKSAGTGHVSGGDDDADGIATQLLDLVDGLLEEVHRGRAQRASALDSVLDRDLGLDSLARTELMLRLERHFGISLPDEILVAETVRDLLRHVLTARGRNAAPALHLQVHRDHVDAEWPVEAATLQEVLAWHVAMHPERVHCRFVDDGSGEAMTCQALHDGAVRVAASLLEAGLKPGGAVALMLPTGPRYLWCFMGILLAGGVPVPIYPPLRPSQLEEHLRRHVKILDSAAVQLLVTVPEAANFARLLKPHVRSLIRIVEPESLLTGPAVLPRIQAAPQDIALLQYTSGSTGQPKGVIVTHANLLANLRGAIHRLEATPSDVFVSWLPLYHDMGLIGAWLGSLYLGCEAVLMSPLQFLGRPSRWLWAMHQYRGTLSAAPNFGFELCLRKIADDELEGLDLSSWRVAMNGAEPVSPATIEGFVRRFSAYGFREGAVSPVYGLAESTVALAMPTPGRGLVVDRVRRDAFRSTGRALPAEVSDRNPLTFVDCGHVLAGHDLRVVGNGGEELGDRREGRLQFRGASATSGYFRNSDATAGLYDGEWLNTGDRAYTADGQLFITGRDKELIIRGGRNIHPYELERAAAEIDGIRRGCVAVLGATDRNSQTEKLVVVAETTERDAAVLDRIREQLDAAAMNLFSVAPDEVVFVPPRTVLKTSSGKIRRTAMRDLYQRGALHRPQRAIRWQILRMTLSAVRFSVQRAVLFATQKLYGVLVLAMTGLAVFPGAIALVVLPGLNARWTVLHRIARLLFRLSGIRITVHGREHIAQDNPPIYVSNHTSYVDALILLSVLPAPVRFIAKVELRGVPLLGWLLARSGLVFVDRSHRQRSSGDAGRLTEHAVAGHSLMVFPEGTFRRHAGLLPFRMGAFRAAAEAGRPVVAAVLRGTRSVLPEGSHLPARHPVSVTFLPPRRADGPEWMHAVALCRAVRNDMLRVVGEPDLDDDSNGNAA